jgi:hypothetical protein
MTSVWSRVSSISATSASPSQTDELQHTLRAHSVAAVAVLKAQQQLQDAIDAQLAAASQLAGSVMLRQAELQGNKSELPGVPTLTFGTQRETQPDKISLFRGWNGSAKQQQDRPIGLGMRH